MPISGRVSAMPGTGCSARSNRIGSCHQRDAAVSAGVSSKGKRHDRHRRHHRPPKSSTAAAIRPSRSMWCWKSGAIGRAAVPSGASTGAHEAVELRDGDKARYGGKGVQKAVDAVNGEIFDALRGIDAAEQVADRQHHDRPRRHAEQEPAGRQRHPGRVARGRQGRGAESATCRCIAMSAASRARTLPVPMMNIINGGVHADNPIDIQEFMILPVGAATLRRGGAHGRGDLPRAEEGAAGCRPQHQCRRRRRLRAEP